MRGWRQREEAMRRATESYRRLAEEDPAGFEAYLAEGRAWLSRA